MKIVSVNVGLPREAVWKGITVRTAIFKEPVASYQATPKNRLHVRKSLLSSET
jgi:hypothetical protein